MSTAAVAPTAAAAKSFMAKTNFFSFIFVGGGVYFAVVLMVAFAYGGPAAINPATSTDFFGPKYSGSNYGVIMLALGLSSVVFNAISNALSAATGAYTLTFLMGAATAALSVIIYLAVGRLRAKAR